MKRLYRIAGALLFIVVVIVSYFVGGTVAGTYQLEIYKILLTVSSVVFAVMGAWLSLLKVEIVNGVDSARTNEEGKEYVEKARRLVSPMTSSAIIISLCLAFVFFYYSFRGSLVVGQNSDVLRRISFSILSGMALWQMGALMKVLFSGVDFLIDVSRRNRRRSWERE